MNSDSLLLELDQETLDFEELLYEVDQLLLLADIEKNANADQFILPADPDING